MSQKNRRRRPTVETMEARTLLSAGLIDYPIPNSPGGRPEAVTTDRRGNIWFAERAQIDHPSEVGRIAPNGKMTLFPLPGNESVEFGGIIAGPDGNIWFTEGSNPAKIGRITPNGAITEFNLPDPSTRLGSITAGRDGNLWFTEEFSAKIGRITPKGQITEFDLPDHGIPSDITAGADGNLWFTESSGIGRITPKGQITEFPLPSQDLQPPRGLTAGPGRAIWFTTGLATNGTAVIGRITPDGKMTQVNVPATNNQFMIDITAGRAGNLWFTEVGPAGGAIGRLTPSGAVTRYPTPNPGAYPFSIVAAPNGSIWFAEPGANAIGKLVPNATRASLHVTATPVTANDGTPFNGVVATFRGVPGNRAAGDYSARIDWGDGVLSTGTVVADGHGGFQVLGTHPYTRFGTYDVKVTVFDQNPRGRNPGPFGSATAQAQVKNAPFTLSGTTIQTTAGLTPYEPFVLASGSTQQVPHDGDLTISIDWGDGTTSPGVVIPLLTFNMFATIPISAQSFLAVGGSHIYQAEGTYNIRVTIHDIGGATTVVNSTAQVSPPPIPVDPWPMPMGTLASS